MLPKIKLKKGAKNDVKIMFNGKRKWIWRKGSSSRSRWRRKEIEILVILLKQKTYIAFLEIINEKKKSYFSKKKERK